jgi:hypothetical protein
VDTTRIGLCWFDGTQFGVLPVENGGLPHAQIPDMEVKDVQYGYELWMSCLSQGIAVLKVLTTPVGITPPFNAAPGFLFKNYPNPFTNRTSLSFSLANEGLISLMIYDINGKAVRDLGRSFFKSGTSTIEWDRRDNNGNRVSPGIYACRLTKGDHSKTILMVVQ